MKEINKYAAASLNPIVDEDLIDDNVIRMRMIQNQAINLYAKKNADYGNAFEKGCDNLGFMYAFSRIWDKTQRFENLAKKYAENENADIRVKDETLNDTILDLANYCFMFLSWYGSVTKTL